MFLKSYFHTPSSAEVQSAVYTVWAGHQQCSGGYVAGPRVLDNYKFAAVVKGKGTFVSEDKEYKLGQGDVFAIFPYAKHLYRSDRDDPMEIMWVSFNGSACKFICKELHLSISSPVIFGSATIEMINLFESVVNDLEANELKFAFKATGHLLLLIDNLIKSTKENDAIISKNIKDDVVKKALEYIEINYYHHIDVDVLCQHVNYSRSYFSRLFKKEVGMTIPQYINKVRVQRAKFLLKNTDLNINEVAKSVGYDDPFYFSRTFKRVTDNSPMKYKTKHMALEQMNVQLTRKGK